MRSRPVSPSIPSHRPSEWRRSLPRLGRLLFGAAVSVGCSDAKTADHDAVNPSVSVTAGTAGESATGGGGPSNTGGMPTSGDASNGGSGGLSNGGTNAGNSGGVSTGGGSGTGDKAGSGGASAGSESMSGSGGASGGGGGSPPGGNGGTGGLAGAAGTAGVSSGGGEDTKSAGCGQERTLESGNHTLTSGGTQRSFALRIPEDYDNTRPYRLMLGFHGATDSSASVAPSYFGLWELSEGSTIFAAPDADNGGLWSADTDTTMVSDLLELLQGDLCIDMSRVEIEGFSQGGAMVWTLACALPGTFRLAVVHSGGGLPMPQSCEPIPFLSMLGNDGSGQGMSSDYFATTNGCTVESFPDPPPGGHACTDYMGCTEGFRTRWCDYDGGHTPAHRDPGQDSSWVPEEVWSFVQDVEAAP